VRCLKRPYFLIAIIVVLSIGACAPYYVKHQRFFAAVRAEKYAEAEAELASSRKAKRKKNRILYLLERGHVSYLQGNYAQCKSYFLEADQLNETYKKQIGTEILAYVLNPKLRPYQAESFEIVMLHYYQAMAYMQTGDYENALVEGRRMNLQLAVMDEKTKEKPKYTRDAFGHMVMGSLYEVSGDANNAFIAYRNALEIYQKDYEELYGIKVPQQLKQDLVRTALQTGFVAEADLYSKEFNIPKDAAKSNADAELILVLESGWGAYKEEWSIDFVFSKHGDVVTFTDPATGMVFNFPSSSISSSDASNLAALKVFRIAFPRYVDTPPFFRSFEITNDGMTFYPEDIQPLNQIAKQSLQDRFMKEMGDALLRFALKKAGEYALSKENKDAGALLGIANAISEQADTRNWQTLPRSISYVRIPLHTGKNLVNVQSTASNSSIRNNVIEIDALKGRKYLRSIRLISATK
jgi:uncharacterized protein